MEAIGNRHDLHLSGYKLPEDFLSQLSTLSYAVVHHPISEPDAREFGGESEPLCRRRYYDAATWGQGYDATCILDADMFFVRNVDLFFEIAQRAQLIVGATLEQKRIYGEEPNQRVRNLQGEFHYLAPRFWNEKDICCAPIFADMRTYCATFKRSWTLFSHDGFKAPDMEAINLMFEVDGIRPRILGLSNSQFVGTNEKLLKPYIRVVRQEQDPAPGAKLWTETGDPIYICHGQFYKAVWRRQQLLNRKGCIDGYIGGSEKCENMAAGALNLLHETFCRYFEGPIRVPAIAYTPNGHPNEDLLHV